MKVLLPNPDISSAASWHFARDFHILFSFCSTHFPTMTKTQLVSSELNALIILWQFTLALLHNNQLQDRTPNIQQKIRSWWACSSPRGIICAVWTVSNAQTTPSWLHKPVSQSMLEFICDVLLKSGVNTTCPIWFWQEWQCKYTTDWFI